jgi:hypothetical protein
LSARLYSRGQTAPEVANLVAFVAGDLWFERDGSKASWTVRLEPWCALLKLAEGWALERAVFDP